MILSSTNRHLILWSTVAFVFLVAVAVMFLKPLPAAGQDTNTPATGQPTISGTPQVLQTLTADISGIAEPDGLSNANFRYSWWADETVTVTIDQQFTEVQRPRHLRSSESPDYVVQPWEEGKKLSVKVRFEDDAGNPESIESLMTEAVVAAETQQAPEAIAATEVSLIGLGKLEVAWERPAYPYGEGSSLITGYKLQWKQTTASWDTQADVSEALISSPETEVMGEISGLTRGSTYSVRVLATNAAGDSPPSEEETVTIPIGICERNPYLQREVLRKVSHLIRLETGLSYGSLYDQERSLRDQEREGRDVEDLRAAIEEGYRFLDVECYEVTENHLSGITDLYLGSTDHTVSNNLGGTLQSGDLSGLTNLRKLNIADRTLTELPDGIFSGLTSLRDLKISHTDLTALPEGVFDDLTRLERLVVSMNSQLTEVPDDVFDNLSNLDFLRVDYNGVTELSASAFDDLSNLRILDLRSNELAGLPDEIFGNLSSLKYLYLGGNELSALPDGAFDNLTNLEGISLNYNDLNTLPEGIFSNLSSLKYLTLRDNELSALPDGVFVGLSSLELLLLHENPGAPFVITAELERQVDNSLVVKVPQGVPYDTNMTLSAYGGTLSSTTVNISSGGTSTGPVSVTPDAEGNGAVVVRVVSTDYPANYTNPYLANYTRGWDVGRGAPTTLTFGGGTNAQPSGAPTISGTAQVGQTLTASDSGITDGDGLDDAEFSYQWVSNDGSVDRDIQGATGATYTLTSFEVEDTIKVLVSFADDAGNYQILASAATGEVAPAPNITATGAPVVVGTAMVGQTLSADTSAISDHNGMTNSTFSYQWISNNGEKDTPVPPLFGGNLSTYTVLSGDEGDTLKVQVSFVDDGGNTETLLTSTPTAVVSSGVNRQATGAPTIGGIAQVDQVLTADISGLADDDGVPEEAFRFKYHWKSKYPSEDQYQELERSSAPTYRIAAGDVGKVIAVTVSFHDELHYQESLTSEPTDVVASSPNTRAMGLPTIGGTARVGETLTADISEIADADGLDNAVFSYQWMRHHGNVDTDIAGATSSTYELSSGDLERSIKVRVSFEDDAGNQEGLTSQPTEPVDFAVSLQQVQSNTSATGVPTISGTVRVGQTLTADTSGIADEDGLTNVVFSYQWIADDTNIQDATGSSYTLTEDHKGKAITVTVTFTDDANNEESLTSEPTGPVALDPGPLTEFTVVDTSSDPDTVLGTLEDGGTLTLEDPDSDRHGIRVDTDSNDDIHKVELALSGAKTEGKEEWKSPYSLYGDDGEDNLTGEDLPAGAYDLTATAYKQDGDVLGTLKVSFTVAEYQPAQQQTVVPNTSATGVPTISGTVRVGQTLTTDTSGIADEDGLTNAVFSYQWMADDTNIQDATGSSYTLTEDHKGKAITVTVTFTDDANNEESLTSEPTGPVAAKPNSPATGPPTISGTARVGQTLTADTSGIADEDGLDNVTFSYQWMADDANIQGATDRTYTLADRDEGKAITVIVSFTDDANNEESLPSAATDAVAAAPAQNSSATGAPSISGTAQVGQTLTADTSGIADEDGLTNAVFSYQWVRNDGNTDEDIAGATGSSYTLTGDDKGKAIKVTVTFTDAEGNPETLTSDPTGEVAAKPNSPATGAPSISGTARVGQTLTADTSGIADEDGLTNAVFSYQWVRNDGNTDEDIAGATGSSYTLTGDDKGKAIKVTVTFTDAEGNPETLTSDPTGEVAAKPNSPATGPPTISGTARVGQTLTADTSGIADEDGLDNVTFSYQWMADDANIQGATDRTYTLADRDEGKAITVIVSFTDDANNEESLPSAATDAVAALPGKPQSLAGEATAQEIKLTWTAPTGDAVVEYVVYRGTLQNGSMNGQALSRYVTIDAAGKAMTYTDDNVEEGVEYRYRVAAVNSTGEGKKSNWLDIKAEEPSP